MVTLYSFSFSKVKSQLWNLALSKLHKCIVLVKGFSQYFVLPRLQLFGSLFQLIGCRHVIQLPESFYRWRFASVVSPLSSFVGKKTKVLVMTLFFFSFCRLTTYYPFAVALLLLRFAFCSWIWRFACFWPRPNTRQNYLIRRFSFSFSFLTSYCFLKYCIIDFVKNGINYFHSDF